MTTYCSIVFGSLMIDLGKARTAETNFPIARYRETTEWERISRKWFISSGTTVTWVRQQTRQDTVVQTGEYTKCIKHCWILVFKILILRNKNNITKQNLTLKNHSRKLESIKCTWGWKTQFFYSWYRFRNLKLGSSRYWVLIRYQPKKITIPLKCEE